MRHRIDLYTGDLTVASLKARLRQSFALVATLAIVPLVGLSALLAPPSAVERVTAPLWRTVWAPVGATLSASRVVVPAFDSAGGGSAPASRDEPVSPLGPLASVFDAARGKVDEGDGTRTGAEVLFGNDGEAVESTVSAEGPGDAVEESHSESAQTASESPPEDAPTPPIDEGSGEGGNEGNTPGSGGGDNGGADWDPGSEAPQGLQGSRPDPGAAEGGEGVGDDTSSADGDTSGSAGNGASLPPSEGADEGATTPPSCADDPTVPGCGEDGGNGNGNGNGNDNGQGNGNGNGQGDGNGNGDGDGNGHGNGNGGATEKPIKPDKPDKPSKPPKPPKDEKGSGQGAAQADRARSARARLESPDEVA